MPDKTAGVVSRGRYAILPACIGAYFAVRFTQVLIGPIVPHVLNTFSTSRSAIGITLTGMWIIYAISQLPSGILADRFGERRIVLTALGIVSAATLGLAVSPTYPFFGIGVLTLGVGAGIYYNPATSILTREFNQVGRTIGTHRIGGQIAGIVAPIVAAIFSIRYGWRVAVGFGAVLTIVVATIFAWVVTLTPYPRTATTLRGLLQPSTLRSLLGESHTRTTILIATIVEFVGLAAMAFLPSFLIEYSGYPIPRANILFAIFFAIATVSQPISGWISDYIGRDTTIAIQLSAGAVGYGILVAYKTLIISSLGIIFAGISMSSVPVIQSRMLDGLTQTNQGIGFGLFRTVYMLFGALGTTVIGTIADLFGWIPAFGLLSMLLALIVVALQFRAERQQIPQ